MKVYLTKRGVAKRLKLAFDHQYCWWDVAEWGSNPPLEPGEVVALVSAKTVHASSDTPATSGRALADFLFEDEEDMSEMTFETFYTVVTENGVVYENVPDYFFVPVLGLKEIESD